jgi:hypothetical protein
MAATAALGGATGLAHPAAAAAADVPMVALGDAGTYEGDTGRRLVKVPVTLSQPLDSAAYFRVEVIGGTATPGVDFPAVAKRVRIREGMTHKTVSIPIFGDTVAEASETIELRITPIDAPPVGFSKPTGLVSILDDDTSPPPKPMVSVTGARMFEGDATPDGVPTSSKVQLTLALSEPQTSDVFVTWHTGVGSASPGSDYDEVVTKTTRIPAGKVQRAILITVHGDVDVEGDEVIPIVIDSVTGGAGVTAAEEQGGLLLVDDDLDTDGDGLVDSAELAWKTDPEDPDTDGDRLSDYEEVAVTGTSPGNWDTDGDGLDDRAEIRVYGTDPTVADTDGDGWDDGAEIAVGTDPLDPTSFPA